MMTPYPILTQEELAEPVPGAERGCGERAARGRLRLPFLDVPLRGQEEMDVLPEERGQQAGADLRGEHGPSVRGRHRFAR